MPAKLTLKENIVGQDQSLRVELTHQPPSVDTANSSVEVRNSFANFFSRTAKGEKKRTGLQKSRTLS